MPNRQGEKERQCPGCGGWVLGEEGWNGVPEDANLCTPVRSPDCWKIVGRATQPHPVTGYQRMLRIVETPDA